MSPARRRIPTPVPLSSLLPLLAALAVLPRPGGGASLPSAGDGGGVIGFDPGILDAEGLIGPPGGKRALDYEFCIPRDEGFVAEVRAIDATARFFDGSRGRIGCGPDQVLVIGNTHRPDFAVVLRRLAGLPYIERIEQAHFE